MSCIPGLTAAAGGGVATGLAIAAIPQWRLYRALRTARHLAHHDDTTGLPNRRAFLTAVAAVIRDGRDFGVILLDLDRFKPVNDRHGHEAGNDVLTEVGRRLAQLPAPVRLVARLSGDEFAILVHGDAEDTDRAARLAAAVITAAPVALDTGVTVAVSASVGYTTTRSGTTARHLLREADDAMYRAKRDGGVVRYRPAADAGEAETGRTRDRR